MPDYGPTVLEAFRIEARHLVDSLANASTAKRPVNLANVARDYRRLKEAIPDDSNVQVLPGMILAAQRRELPKAAAIVLKRAESDLADEHVDLVWLQGMHAEFVERIPEDPAVVRIGQIIDEVEAEAAERKARQEQARQREEEERRMRILNRPAPPPEPQPYGVSHEGAESLACDWMRHLGVRDAEVTRLVGDGGIDIDSAEFVAQVKNYAGSVAVQDVRALFGVAVASDRKALLFTSGVVTAEGRSFADKVGMAVIQYDAVAGTLEGLNPLGTRCVEYGIPESFAELDSRSS